MSLTVWVESIPSPWDECLECGHEYQHHEPAGNEQHAINDGDFEYIEGTCLARDFPSTCDCAGFRKPAIDRPVDGQNQTKGITMSETLVETKPKYVLKNGREYITRPLSGFENDVEGLRWLVNNGVNVLLLGDPGCGKTALMEAAFPQAHNEIMHSRMTQFDMKWIARPVIMPDGTTGVVFDPAPLTRAALQGVPVYIDEIMRGGDDSFTPLFSAMDGRDIIIGGNQDGTDLKIEPGFGVVASSNPFVRGAFLPDAIASRFFILEVQTTLETLKRLGISDPLTTIWSNLSGQNDVWVPSIRDLLTAQKFLELGNKYAATFALTGYRVPAKDREAVSGVVGLTLGTRVGAEGGVIK